MAAPIRTEEKHESDLALIAELYCKHQTQAEIASVIGVTQQQISYDLKIIRTRWIENTERDMTEIKAGELAKLDTVEGEYWAAWERSKASKERSIKQRSDTRLGSQDMVRIDTEQRDGNPQFLDGVVRCLERRAKLLGLDAPTKVDVTGRLATWAVERGVDPDMLIREAQLVLAERAGQGG